MHRMLIGCFLLLASLLAAAEDPAWYNQPQFFNFFQSPNDPNITRVPFTGQAWGFGFNIYPASLSDVPLQQEIATWKAKNGAYFASVSLDTIYFSLGNGPDPTWDAFRMRSLNGHYLDQSDTRKSTFADYSLSSPVYQAAFIAWAQQAVDAGADGLQIDDVGSQLAAILYYAPAQAGSFDAITMGAFRTYLQQRYSPSILAAQFGIADIATFNFGSYIQAKSLSSTWNQKPLTGVSKEFFLFKRQESLNFLRNLITSTKQYAQQEYGRTFLFTCNDGDDPLGYFITEVMDLTTPELFYIQGMDHPFGAIDVKSWTGWKRPTIPLPETAPSILSLVTSPLATPTVNLERVIIADIQAAGGMAGATLQMNQGLGVPEPVDLSVVNRYANFILGNPQLMSQTITPARVALLHSAPSVLGGVLSNPGQGSPWNGPTNYTGTARLLLDSGLTYDAMFLPDSTYSQLASPQAVDLAKYSVVIAPSTFSLDDNQVATLLAYAKRGGTLIIDGDFATNEPSGQPAIHPELQSILAAPGQTPYGAGKVVFSKELFGVEYQATGNTVQRQARASFLAFIVPFIQPDVQIIQPPAQIHEPGITPFLYHDRTGNALVHLVNYDYDLGSDQFYSKTNVTVNVHVGTQVVDEVILRSPDIAGAQTLPFTRNGDTITLTIPQVDAWVVLYFQQKGLAPVVTSASPAAALGAVGGNTLAFSVQAFDPNGNPLTYTWSVNGKVVADVFGPNYTFQIPASANSIYTVTVAVTDGSRTTQTSWAINVAAYKQPRVLFDESHAERYTINPARASQLNPQHPDYVLLGLLNQAMQPGYQVSSFTAGLITTQVLSGADVLVLAAPSAALSDAENQAISSFVQAGGGLIFLGDAGSDTSINTLIGPWGFQFDHTLIESRQNSNCPPCFNLSFFANLPAVGTNPSFVTDYSGSFSVSQGAVALGKTSAAEWKSTSGQPTQQSGETNGPFVMIAAASPGKGRVFVSDTAFFDNYLQHATGNLNLFFSGLSWISANVNPAPATPAASPSLGGSIAHLASGGGWDTTLTLVNSGAASGQALLSLNDSNGNSLQLPFTFPQTASDTAPLLASTLDCTINANAQLVMESTGPDSATPLVGWGQLLTNGSISGFGIFSNPKSHWSAVVPLETRNASSYMLAFDNTGSLVTGVAVANVSTQAAAINVIIRDDTGSQIGSATISLDAQGHTSFMLNKQYSVTAGKRGTIEFDTPLGGQISVLGLRANGSALTTLPVVANVGTNGGSITHATFNGGFTSTFYLVNTGPTSAQFTLSFFDEGGNALQVPLSLPESGTATTTAALTQTLAAGAMLVVQTQAQDALPSVVGSAQLTTTGNISGFEIFRWTTFGQEASVPLETRTPNSFVLVFDDTNDLTTGVALANLAGSAANVTLNLRDDKGALLQTATINLASRGHTSFLLPSKYAATENLRGSAEFVVPTGGKISLIGLRAKSDGTLTTMPVLVK